MIVVTALAVAGFALLISALYLWLEVWLGSAGAAAICGGVCLLLAAAGVVYARRLT